jgi:hypothetical protein
MQIDRRAETDRTAQQAVLKLTGPTVGQLASQCRRSSPIKEASATPSLLLRLGSQHLSHLKLFVTGPKLRR